MAHRSSSSSITYKWPYDVFLSFYGDDTRLGFISHLYESLRRCGIHAFIDYKIRDGENITPALFKAIEESRIAIIVFSKNYANSTFCLKELEKIVDCFKEESRLIYPVFYYVDPSELRRPRGSYAEALARLEERFKDEGHRMEKWRQALSQAADLKGCHLKSKIANEQECIKRITSEVAARINLKPLHVTDYPVGLLSRVKEIISYLDLWSIKEIKMIGIWGAGGIGKSTIARAVYNSIADNFEGVSFLFDVRKQSKMPNGLSHLQEKLLGRLVMEKDLKLSDYHEGIPILEHRLSQKKILLILDNVDESDQLKALAGSCDWFGYGSRIIITTRNKQLLKSHGIKRIYDVKELNGEESLKLLTWYAFKKENVDSNYMEVCKRVTHYSCGFPLVLEVIGSNLYGKEVSQWSSALDQFKSIPNKKVLDVLKLSFDMLEEVEKRVFLDLACFFNGEELAHVNDMLLCIHGIRLEYAIGTLVDKSLMKIEQNCIAMHDLIEDLGKEIVRQESSDEPGERSRLWFYEDILQVLQQDTGTNKVKAIILDLPEGIEVQWSGEAFEKMRSLKMLVIRKACFSECPKYLPNSLKWLEWKGYPFKILPFPMRPTELVYLDLSYSCCECLQPFDKNFLNLSHMNLRNCKFLQQIPDLSGASNLRELWLDGCTNLLEIHDSVGCLIKLTELSAMRCKKLKILPSCLRLSSLKHLNLIGCSSLQRFPEISVMMEEIRTLDLDKTAIIELPSSVCNLIGLEMLNVEECRNLKQLPSSICKLPKLWKLTADYCEEMSHFKMCEGGDEASLDGSKMTHLHFSSCKLSDNSLVFCLSHFTKIEHLDLSFNNFTILPECIKEHCNLKYLLLDNCKQLQHIGGMPPNLEKFSAICCTSLTNLSKSKVLKQAFNFQPVKRNFILPGRKLPKRLHYCRRGRFLSFWVRNVFPRTFLWILVKDDQDYIYNCQFSVHTNGYTKLDISSKWHSQSTIKTNHIYICDMQSMIQSKSPLGNEWNEVNFSIGSKTQEIEAVKEIYFGVYADNLQSSLENIKFVDPGRCIIDHNLLRNIKAQEDLEELEEDMNLDLSSTESAELIENPMHYREREIMNELGPLDLRVLVVTGYMGTTFPTLLVSGSYNHLTELRLIDCQHCVRIPALGQLPALRDLTIEGLHSVVAVGSEFFKGHDCASLIPFPSLESLKFANMISWEEWYSVDMEAFPKLRTLRFDDCPKLIGNLPLQLVSLECLEIVACPLLASPIPKYKFLKPLLDDMKHLLPNLRQLRVERCPEMEPFSAGSLPSSLEQLEIIECDKLLSDNSLVFCLSHLTKIEHLDLSFNNFTILPECIKEHCNLKCLFLDNCNQLQHIGGMPPNLEKFSAICCTSLTELSKSKVLKQAFNFQPVGRDFILPGRKLPKRLHYCRRVRRRSFLSFWVRNLFPRTFLWILVKDDQDYVYNCQFSAYANTKPDFSSRWRFLSAIRTNHIYIRDMQSMIETELLRNKWNRVDVSLSLQNKLVETEVYFGVYADNLQGSFENIQFVDPRHCIIDSSLLQNIQGQEDLEELEDDMNLDLNSTKSAELIENPMHDREREIMNKLQPWDLRFLEVAGYRGTTFPTWLGSRSYNDLTELRLIDCQNCWRIPALGQLPALRYLTIEGLQSVVVVGSEFFEGHDCASLILFPSLESLKFANMISWEEWHSVDKEAFPKLHTLHFDCCPKLIGYLPLQLVPLGRLEIVACPLLASPIPKYPKIHTLRIIKSQNVVLQEQAFPPSLHFLEFSDARMLEPLSEKLHIEHLGLRNCSDAVPLSVIHMPPSAVEKLTLADCESLKFVLISKAPLVHLEIICIFECKFLKSLLDDMERLLPNLRQLRIVRCPEMEPFSAGSLPSSVEQLEIIGCDKLLSSHTEWHHLPTITKLLISTPSDTLHCRGLQHLTSLQELQISESPKLETIHGGMMPPSLRRLIISGRCLLEERCRNKDEEIWPKISHVPHISLDGMDLRIYEQMMRKLGLL